MAVWEINSRHLLLVSHPVYFVPWLSDNRWNEVRTIHHTISRVYCAVYLSFLLFSYTTVFCPSCLCFPILQLYCILCTSFTVYICSPIHTVFACPASQQAFLRSYLLYLSVIIPHFSFFVVHYLAAKPCVLHICRGFLYCTSVTCLWSPNLPTSRLRKFALFSIKLFAILLFLGVSAIDLRIFATCFPRDCAKNKASAHIWWQVYWSL